MVTVKGKGKREHRTYTCYASIGQKAEGKRNMVKEGKRKKGNGRREKEGGKRVFFYLFYFVFMFYCSSVSFTRASSMSVPPGISIRNIVPRWSMPRRRVSRCWPGVRGSSPPVLSWSRRCRFRLILQKLASN